jgi:hypothetical protein
VRETSRRSWRFCAPARWTNAPRKPDQRRIVVNAFESGLSAGFRMVVIFGIIGLVLAFVLRQEPLRESMD